jgi:hypothetical protein
VTAMVVPKNCGLLSRGHVSHTQPILSEADSGQVVGNPMSGYADSRANWSQIHISRIFIRHIDDSQVEISP